MLIVLKRYECCALCGKWTCINKNMPIALRQGYVEGLGQLCTACDAKYRNGRLADGSFLSSEQEGYEYCVICHRQTNVPCGLSVEYRQFYVEGVGQLCRECYQETV